MGLDHNKMTLWKRMKINDAMIESYEAFMSEVLHLG